ncbi:fibronectin type III domain-containing protein, partial [Aphanizomenon sp. 202]|nr:fibronectin type III domain-containing protein [Aphanizomenon sp. 202]
AYASTSAEVTSEPLGLSLFSATASSLDLIWFRPSTNPDCVQRYELQWSSASGGSGSQTISGPLFYEVETTITGLAACTPYDLSVTAVSAVGESLATTLTASTLC